MEISMGHNQQGNHFLFVTVDHHGQITAARHLGTRLARINGARVTIASPVSSLRRMFPSADNIIDVDDDDGITISYACYSDGFDQGHKDKTGDLTDFVAQLRRTGSRTLAALARSLADRGRPVSCVVYSFLTDWAADVASNDLGVPYLLIWPQPAAVFSIFYHYFNCGYDEVIKAHLNDDEQFRLNMPGLPPLELKDLPALLTTDPGNALMGTYRNTIQSTVLQTAHRRPAVLMSSFRALEADAIETLDQHLNVICFGPMMDTAGSAAGVGDESKLYMDWLEDKEEGSVVYVCDGSLGSFTPRQMEELSKGLRESGRPYLWIVKKDVRERHAALVARLIADGGGAGLVMIGWCDQVRVLGHRATGCFVTHSGCNAVLESVMCGVPMVALPQRVDQHTNAKVAEAVWGTTVIARVDEEGVAAGTELRRCLELVKGLKKRVEELKKKAAEAAADQETAVRDIVAYLEHK